MQGYLHLGDTVYALHQFLVARRYYERAVRETDERKSLTELRLPHTRRRGHCTHTWALLQKLGDRNRVLVLHNLATVEGDQGLWHSALPKFETCQEAYRVFGWPAHEAALVEELALLEQQDEPILRGRLLGLRGKLRLAQGDVQWGRELLQTKPASSAILRTKRQSRGCSTRPCPLG